LLVTRPIEQAGTLAQAIKAAGGEAWLLPTLEIVAVEDNPELDAGLRHLARYDLVIFVSANAVREALARCLKLGLPGLSGIVMAGAPGPATAAEVAAAGVAEVLAPTSRFDSEGLIEAMIERKLAPVRVLMLRGADDEASGSGGSGREKLMHWLRQRGAQVDVLACYRRVRARPDARRLASMFAAPAPDATVVTSSEGGRSLVAMLGAAGMAWLGDVPMFVPHPRIGDVMGELGFGRIHVTAGGDAGLLRGLAAHFDTGAA
jgi:uroporphyrinogen-III synthase